MKCYSSSGSLITHTYKLTIRIREEEWPVIFLLIHLHVFIEAKPVGERDGEGNIKSMK